jgi:hypothetical protein
MTTVKHQFILKSSIATQILEILIKGIIRQRLIKGYYKTLCSMHSSVENQGLKDLRLRTSISARGCYNKPELQYKRYQQWTLSPKL